MSYERIKFYQTGSFAVGNRLLGEEQRSVQSGTGRSNTLTCGHRACQGCGEALGARYALDAAMRATQGFVKILADVETDRVLGGSIVGKNASEMIHEIVVLMEFSGAAEDLARTTHAHPTLSEAVREAALMCGDGAIHI